MAATKYAPENLFGGAPVSTLTTVFTPDAGEEYVLTEILAANTSTSARKLSVSWTKSGNDIFLVFEALMPANSAMNYNLYLPITSANPLKAAAASGDVLLTLNGLHLVEV